MTDILFVFGNSTKKCKSDGSFGSFVSIDGGGNGMIESVGKLFFLWKLLELELIKFVMISQFLSILYMIGFDESFEDGKSLPNIELVIISSCEYSSYVDLVSRFDAIYIITHQYDLFIPWNSAWCYFWWRLL